MAARPAWLTLSSSEINGSKLVSVTYWNVELTPPLNVENEQEKGELHGTGGSLSGFIKTNRWSQNKSQLQFITMSSYNWR